jgi:hypothetical protein
VFSGLITNLLKTTICDNLWQRCLIEWDVFCHKLSQIVVVSRFVIEPENTFFLMSSFSSTSIGSYLISEILTFSGARQNDKHHYSTNKWDFNLWSWSQMDFNLWSWSQIDLNLWSDHKSIWICDPDHKSIWICDPDHKSIWICDQLFKYLKRDTHRDGEFCKIQKQQKRNNSNILLAILLKKTV